MPHVTIDPTRYDAESPITESLMSDIIGNIAFNNAEGGIDGTNGGGTLGSASGSPTVFAISGTIMVLECAASSFDVVFNSDDDSALSDTIKTTLTASFQEITTNLFARKNGTNYEVYYTAAGLYQYR